MYRDDPEELAARLRWLSQIRIASPCDASWDAMAGDDRVRQCALCDRPVYDVSAMSSAEAIALLTRDGEAPCVQLRRRRDGTVITSDCERGRTRRRRRLVTLSASACVAAGIAAVAATARPQPVAPPPVRVSAETRRRAATHEEVERAAAQVDAMLMGTLHGEGTFRGRVSVPPRTPEE